MNNNSFNKVDSSLSKLMSSVISLELLFSPYEGNVDYPKVSRLAMSFEKNTKP